MTNLSFAEVENYLYARIHEKIDIGYSAGFSLERVKYTLELLENPQEKIKTIHIAGTSGKGSTAMFISKLLVTHGFKTGLTLSPHLVDIRERVQINNELLSHEQFAANFCELLPIFEKVAKSKYQSLSYFEMLMILAYYTFAKERVDYAVIETGLGGTFDASNCINNRDKLCVITRIGKDHIHILGKTIAEIATNKAGIINKGQGVVYMKSGKISDSVIENRAISTKSEIFPLTLSKTITIHKSTQLGKNKDIHINPNTDFHFGDTTLANLPTQTLPTYQLENLALSLSALVLLSKKYNWEIKPDRVRDIVKNFSFSGRFEVIKTPTNTIILDGAHNPQKIKALTISLNKKFPNQKFNFIVAFKEDKDIKSMLRTLKTVAYNFFPTRFHLSNQDIKLKSINPDHIEKILKLFKFTGKIYATQNLDEALEASQECYTNQKDYEYNHNQNATTITVITGSLYLVAEFKNRYPYYK